MTGISQTNPRSILIFKKMTKGHQSISMPDKFSVIFCRLDFGFPINFNISNETNNCPKSRTYFAQGMFSSSCGMNKLNTI